MATLGSTTKPSTSQEGFGLNVQNSHAIKLTMPAGGPWLITKVAVWAAGLNTSSAFRTCVWSSGGTVRGWSTVENLTDRGALTLGDGDLWNLDMITPYEAYGGQIIYIGYQRTSGGASQHPLTGSGSHVDDDQPTIPGNINVGATHGGQIGAYLTYIAANEAPNAPSPVSPAANARLTDHTPELKATHSDPNGDALYRYDVQVARDSGFTDLAWSANDQTTGISGNTVTRATITLSPDDYWWRFRTQDAGGLTGPWMTARKFTINALPSATKTSPVANGFPVIHNLGTDLTAWTLAGAHAKPRFKWTFSDPNGDAQSAYRVRIYSAASGGTLLYDSTAVGSSSKEHDATWAGVMGTEYWWTLDVRDAYVEWLSDGLPGGPSDLPRTAFKMRWGQAIYEANPGASSAGYSFTPGSVSGGEAKFMFRSASISGGGIVGTWQANVGNLPSTPWVQILVRLAPYTPGTHVVLPEMLFYYTASSAVPEQYALAPSPDWVLDATTRRFGSRGLRCTHSGGATDRTLWQQINVTPNTDYVYSAYVSTGEAAVAGSISLLLTEQGSITTPLDVVLLPVVDAALLTNDTSGFSDRWQRLALRFRTGSQTEIGVGMKWAGGASGQQVWFDGLQVEESLIPTPWRPGLTGRGVTIDVGGIQLDALEGAVFRLRGATGGVRDVIELGANGLVFGGPTSPVAISSPVAGQLDVAGILSSTRIGRSVYHNGPLSLLNNAGNRLTYTTVAWLDAFTTHNTGSTIIAVAGMYLITVHVEFPSSATGSWRAIGVGRGAGTHATNWGGWTSPANTYNQNYGTPNAGTIRAQYSAVLPLSVGDWVSAWAFHTYGVTTDVTNVEFTVLRVGA